MTDGTASFTVGYCLHLCVVSVCLTVALTQRVQAQSRDDIQQVQKGLIEYGVMRTDGTFDQSTQKAIQLYQRDWGLALTGKITPELISRLSGRHPATRPQWRKAENNDCLIWSNQPAAREIITWAGECIDGRASGKGVLQMSWRKRGRTERINYVGSYLDGRAHGLGHIVYADGDRYAGQFENGHRHGRGIFYWRGGTQYQGQFKNGYRHGHGKLLLANGDRYSGNWRRGKPHGLGTYVPVDEPPEARQWRDGCSELNGRIRWLFTSREACGY